MSARGNTLDRARKLAAYRLKMKGLTTRQIAEQIGIKPAQVKSFAEAGARISTLTDQIYVAEPATEQKT